MSSYPYLQPSNTFNPSLFINTTEGITLAQADLRYVRIGGDVNANIVRCNSLYVGGALTDLTAISGITHGIVSSDKAVIVDNNKDIAGFRNLSCSGNISGTISTASQPNITSVGTLSSLGVSGLSNLNTLSVNGMVSSTANVIQTSSSIQITGGSVPSGPGAVGGGFRYSGINATFYISAHNHFLSTHNNIDIQDQMLYFKSNTNVGMFTNDPRAYIDINQASSASNRLRFSYTIGSSFVETWCDSASYLNVSNTPTLGDNSTRIANTGFVQTELLDRTPGLTGFVNRTDSLISYNANSRILTISPASTSYVFWVAGVKFIKSSPITTSAHSTTSGATYWVYFDNVGNLQIATSAPNFDTSAMVCVIYYYSATQTIVLEERHGILMDPRTHSELHNTIGCFYKSGLAISGYTLSGTTDADNTWTTNPGVISDEDLDLTIGTQGESNYTVFSLISASALWTLSFANATPFLYTPAGYIQYNQWTGSTWQMTQGSNGNFYTSYILFVGSQSLSTQILIVPGQTEYASLSSAAAEVFANLSTSSLILPEYLCLYKIIWRTSSSYTTTGKCRIEQVDRVVSTRVSIAANVATNHQSLSNLQLAAAGSTYGHISDQAQTIAGVKTFSSNPILTLATASQPNVTSVGTLSTLQVGVTSTQNGFITSKGNGVDYLDGAFSKIIYASGSDAAPVSMALEVSNGPAAVSTNAGWIGTKTNNDMRIGSNDTSRLIITAAGVSTFNNTTDSSSISTGALIISGGVGIAKNLYVGTGIYGTLQTAAQANITSVGTLTGLNTSGVINVTSTSNDGLKITNSNSSALANIKLVTDNATWEVGARGSASSPASGFYIYNTAIRFYIDTAGRCGFGGKTSSLLSEIDVNGSINCSADYTVAGASINVRALTNVASGTVSASKAIIVDSNRAITNMGSISIEDANAFPLNVYNSSLTTTNSIGINLGKSAATNESFQMKFNYDTTSTDTSYLSFSPYGQTNSFVIKSNENIGIRSISNPLWPIHGPNTAQDQVLALYCTAVDADFYGIGTNTNSMLYQASQTHKFFYASKGKLTGDGKGTLIAQFDASGLYVERYTSGADASGTYSYLNSVEFKLNEVAPSATYSYSIECAQGVVCNSGGFFARSDRRLKRDIIMYNNEHNQRLIDGIDKIELASFIMKSDDTNRRQTGLIAQDVVRAGLIELISFIDCPELDIEDELDIENIAMTVDYSKIGLMLIPYVQMLHKKIKDLEQTIDSFTSVTL